MRTGEIVFCPTYLTARILTRAEHLTKRAEGLLVQGQGGVYHYDECEEFRESMERLFKEVLSQIKQMRYDFLERAVDIDLVKSIYLDRPHEVVVIPEAERRGRRAEVAIYIDPMSVAVSGERGECRYNRVADHNRVSYYNGLLEYIEALSERRGLQARAVGRRTRSVTSIAVEQMN
jgi:hypothetical protein